MLYVEDLLNDVTYLMCGLLYFGGGRAEQDTATSLSTHTSHERRACPRQQFEILSDEIFLDVHV